MSVRGIHGRNSCPLDTHISLKEIARWRQNESIADNDRESHVNFSPLCNIAPGSLPIQALNLL